MLIKCLKLFVEILVCVCVCVCVILHLYMAITMQRSMKKNLTALPGINQFPFPAEGEGKLKKLKIMRKIQKTLLSVFLLSCMLLTSYAFRPIDWKLRLSNGCYVRAKGWVELTWTGQLKCYDITIISIPGSTNTGDPCPQIHIHLQQNC